MISPNDFWLQLHRLAEAYDAEGLTDEERAINITDELLSLPLSVRMQAGMTCGSWPRASTILLQLWPRP